MSLNYKKVHPNDAENLLTYLQNKYDNQQAIDILMNVFEWKISGEVCFTYNTITYGIDVTLTHHYFNDDLVIYVRDCSEDVCEKFCAIYLPHSFSFYKASAKEHYKEFKEAS